MTRSKLATTFAALVLVASTAHAESPVSVQLTAPYAPNQGAVTAFGYYMHPYSGTMDRTAERLNAVDFFHDVSLGDVWKVTSANLGAAIRTAASRHWSLLSYTGEWLNGGYTPSAALSFYEQVASLTTQYAANPSTNATQAQAIQSAIGSLGDYVGSLNVNGTNAHSADFWMNQVQSKYNQQAADEYDRLNVLGDVSKGTAAGTVQASVYATPEPGTMSLIGTGLMMMTGIGFKRRRKDAAAVELDADAAI